MIYLQETKPEMTKIEAAKAEYREWCNAIGIDSLSKMNEAIEGGKAVQFINLCEARQERKYAGIADQIFWNSRRKRIVMMAGPSSSGKTSSSLRIAQQCRVLGLTPKVIELDNFFVDREQTPRDENGEYDFEALGAMDIELLGTTLNGLLEGREMELPRYDFKEGRKELGAFRMKLEDGDILMMEGIHGLNPELTPSVDPKKIFHIYISALSALDISETSHGSTTDKRLLRRIVRDNRTRGAGPEESILRWPSVRDGEIRNIFPFEENADVVFNSSMLYDLPMLKYFAEPLLEGILETSPAFPKAQSLLELLSRIIALKPAEIAVIPPTSIAREFIGGQKL